MTEVTTRTPTIDTVVKPTESQAVAVAHTAPESKKDDASQKEPILGFIAPQSWLGQEFTKIGNEFQGHRNSTINFLPTFLVNHSSNVIGTTHLIGEGLMFKASGNQLYQGSKIGADGKKVTDYFHGSFQSWLENKHPNLSAAKGTGFTSKLLRGVNPAVEPIYNIVNDAVVKGGFGLKASDLLKPTFYKQTAQSFVNLEKASEIDRAALAPGQKLINRWQTRATFLGMIGMTVSTLMPDDKDTPEEVEKRTQMATLHPLQYTGQRIATAINPLNWWDNKRAFIGFMMTACGASTFLASFRNVSEGTKYFRNPAHGYGGIITAIAGSQLIMSPSADQGWSRWGSIMWARMAFLYKSISTRYQKKDENAHYYSMGQLALQTSNCESFFFGGAEKLPDGTIIDHKKIRDEAKQKAREEKEKRHAEKEAGHDHSTHGALVSTPEMANQFAAPEAVPTITSTVPEVTTVATPSTVIAANEAHHTAPEKSQEIAA